MRLRLGSNASLLATALLVFGATEALAAEPHFLNPHSLTSGVVRPTFLHVADFTGDGRNDILAAAKEDIAVLAGHDRGNFDAPVMTSAGFLQVLAVGDFNGDRVLDLLVAPRAQNGLRDSFGVMRGAGNGTFAAPYVTQSDRYASLVVADFDGDGISDLATFHEQQGVGARIHRGSSDGGFGAPRLSYIRLNEVSEARAGDFDGDGRPDVAVGGDSLTVFWNNHGLALTGRVYSGEDAPSIAVGDLNADGSADVMVSANIAYVAAGSRTFRRTQIADTARDSIQFLADFDRNWTADIVSVSEKLATIQILTSPRAGETSTARLYFTGMKPELTAIGDIDSDGRKDVLFASEQDPDAVSWISGNGDGTLRANPAIDLCRTIACDLLQVAAMDVDGDGRLDVVAYDGSERLTTFRSVAADGWAQPVTMQRQSNFVGHVVPADDLDGDGRADILIGEYLVDSPSDSASFTWTVLHGQADGTFHAGVKIRSLKDRSWRPEVVVGDLTRDGVADLLDRTGVLLPGLGNGDFGEPIATNVVAQGGWNSSLRLADFDSDGRLDVLLRDLHKRDRIFLNEGTAMFRAVEVGSDPEGELFVADFTGDGIPDVMETSLNLDNSYDFPYSGRRSVSLSRGVGNGTLQRLDTGVDLSNSTSGAAAADFDGDGVIDVVVGTDLLLGDRVNGIRSASALRVDPSEVRQYSSYRGDTFSVVAVRPTDGDRPPVAVIGNRQNGIYALVQTSFRNDPTREPTLTIDSPTAFSRATQRKTVRVRVSSEGTRRPTGSVRFDIGGEIIAPYWRPKPPSTILVVVDEAGYASITKRFHGGTLPITATYLGDEHFFPTTRARQFEFERMPTVVRTSRFPGPGPYRLGKSIAFVFQLVHLENGPFADSEGEFTLRKDGLLLYKISNEWLSYATVSPSLFPVGTHTVTATWTGTRDYLPSSASVTFSVVP